MNLHPLAQLFPPMSDVDFQELVKDIKAHGQHQAITTHDGMILDGSHRHRACLKLGIKPRTEELGMLEDPLAFVLSANLFRRQLTESQRAIIAADIANMDRGGQPSAPVQKVSQSQAAEKMGVSTRTVNAATRIKKEAPERVEAIRSGETTVKAVEREIKQAKEKALPKPKPAESGTTDAFGREVPVEIEAEWIAALEFSKPIVKELLGIKQRVHKARESKLRQFAKLSCTVEAALESIRGTISSDCEPYTICPTCNAHDPSRCKSCRGTGWHSRYVYERGTSSDIRAMWENNR